ncbi:MAG TPA: hypothetical protein VLW25_06555 [Bryobacteraceae bacterium]|nr:hypothetical protein [Bryobacteraceae bacterium]
MWRQAARALIMLLAASALAQENAPQGFLRGDLIRWQGAPDQGQFTFLVWPDHVYTCSYDDRTYVERDKQRVTMDRLAKGDHLEVVADRQADSLHCYARAIQIQPQFLPGANLRMLEPLAAESLPFTLSGAVSSITPELLILRLRSGAHKVIRLRPETRYLQDGQATDRSALAANRVVFIRATKDLHGETEASQVIWGKILQPQP